MKKNTPIKEPKWKKKLWAETFDGIHTWINIGKVTVGEWRYRYVWAEGKLYLPDHPDFQKALDGKFSWNKDKNEET